MSLKVIRKHKSRFLTIPAFMCPQPSPDIITLLQISGESWGLPELLKIGFMCFLKTFNDIITLLKSRYDPGSWVISDQEAELLSLKVIRKH